MINAGVIIAVLVVNTLVIVSAYFERNKLIAELTKLKADLVAVDSRLETEAKTLAARIRAKL